MSNISDDGASVYTSSSAQNFQDTKAYVRITSSDGQVFYIQSYYLMAGSVVLRDMVEVARPKESPSDAFDLRTVEIDAPGESVSLFLHLFIGTPPPDPALERPKTSTMLDVIRLVDKFDCIIRDRLRVRIRLEAEYHGGWGSFVYAARIPS